MGHSVPLPNSPIGPVAASWLISCVLHAGLVVAAVLFVQRIQLAAQTEPFQWDVAVVATLSTSVSATPSPQPTPTPALRHSTPPAKAVRPIAEAVESAPMQPATSPIPAATAASDWKSSQDQPLHTEPKLSSAAPSSSAEPLTDSPPQHLSATLSEQAMPSRDYSTALAGSQTTMDSTLTPYASTDQRNPARTDYGWLAALMAQWIADLNKRYPAMLRTEGMQGKVTLTAMLHDNGRLSDVRVVKSSGHAALDQVAVEDVTNGSPITLSHPLDRAQMPVRFSISYDLKTVR